MPEELGNILIISAILQCGSIYISYYGIKNFIRNTLELVYSDIGNQQVYLSVS